MSGLLLATDLDRTLLPNGRQPESPGAREAFARVAAGPGCTLVYVSGRDYGRVRAAIDEYGIPFPVYVVADVGASIHRPDGALWGEWAEVLAVDWPAETGADLERLLRGIAGLRPQEADRQGRFKRSWYWAADGVAGTPDRLEAEIRARLAGAGVRARLIWSLDETTGVGLLDLLPPAASKRHALEFLGRRLGLPDEAMLFAGDSGNDLEVLVSPIPAVLVANATAEVRRQAQEQSQAAGHPEALYLARGGWQGMNGCYAAGILEGLAHFHPQWATLGAGVGRQAGHPKPRPTGAP